MKFFKIVLIITGFLGFLPILSAGAAEKCDFCTALDTGIGSKAGSPTDCLIEITAPTFGGEVALDVRDATGKSLWGKPRIKQSASGTVVYHIGCSQIRSPTDQVYLCVDGRKGGDGKTYHSSRFRAEGTIDTALKTHKLEMCLKGPACAKWHEPPSIQKAVPKQIEGEKLMI